MGELLHIPESDPITIAERLRDPEVQRMLERHTLELDAIGLLEIYRTELGNTRFMDSTPNFLRQDDNFADFLVRKYLGRLASLNIDAPILVSKEVMPSEKGIGILESTTLELIKVSPVTGAVYPESQLDIYEETEEFGLENLMDLPISTIDTVKRHYQEQVDMGIILKGQYPKEAGIL